MKKRIKILLAIVIALVIVFASAVGLVGNTSNFPAPVASGTQVRTAANKAEVDFSNTKDGYIMARWLGAANADARVVIIGPGNVQYQYRLNTAGTWEVFPLSDGNGQYTIRVMEGVGGGRFTAPINFNTTVTLATEFAPFLRPNQFVNFNADSKAVAKAAELVKGSTGVLDSVARVYNFVIENVKYDHELAKTVQSGYVPDVDRTLETKKGICFDYASLMTAMLRSQDIPTKLVVGYAGDAYHAWINVYSPETGWINNLVYFDGSKWNLMDPTFASSAKQSTEVMKYIGDGKNYKAMYLY